MKNNSYEQFFKTAQNVKRSDDPPVTVNFSLKSKGGRPESALLKKTSEEAHEKRLRRAVKMRRPKPPLPKKAVTGLVVSLAIAVTYVLWPDAFEHILNKIEISAMGQASAADKAAAKKADEKSSEKAAEKSAEKSQSAQSRSEKSAGGETSVGKGKSPEDKSAVHEELGHYEKLKQRKEELDAREKELTELEEELQRQKVELDRRITQLEEMRSQIAQTLKDRVEIDQEKVTKLVDLYSNMKPKQAADVINSINEELAVEVLAKMKKKNAAEIMNLLPPDKARVLSEKYTGYRRGKDEPKG